MLTLDRARPHPRYIYAHSVQNRLRLACSRLFVLAPTLAPTRPHSPSDAHSRSHSLTPAHAHTRAHTLGEATVSGIDAHAHAHAPRTRAITLRHLMPTRPRSLTHPLAHAWEATVSGIDTHAHTLPHAHTPARSPPRPRAGEATVSGIDAHPHSRPHAPPHALAPTPTRWGRLRYQA